MKNILILEDEPLIQLLYKAALKRYPSETYTLFQAYSIREALEIYQREDISLLILDYNLPDGNSCEFVKQIDVKCPIVVISGHTKETLACQFKGQKRVINEVISKPIDLSSFREIIDDYVDPLNNKYIHPFTAFFKETCYAF